MKKSYPLSGEKDKLHFESYSRQHFACYSFWLLNGYIFLVLVCRAVSAWFTWKFVWILEIWTIPNVSADVYSDLIQYDVNSVVSYFRNSILSLKPSVSLLFVVLSYQHWQQVYIKKRKRKYSRKKSNLLY